MRLEKLEQSIKCDKLKLSAYSTLGLYEKAVEVYQKHP